MPPTRMAPEVTLGRGPGFPRSLHSAVRSASDAKADFSYSDTPRTRSYDVDVPFMQLERHGWDIHAVSAGPH
jgi:hypothetical protein